jgi:hypothetical protein
MFKNYNLKLQEKFKKFPYKLEYIHSVDGCDIDIPMKYEDLTSVMFFFLVEMNKAKKYIKDDNIQLVPFLGKFTLLAVNIFEYRKNPAGPFGEFTFSFPVMNQSKKSVPLLPLIFDQKFNNFGFYVIQLGATNDMARDHIEDIWGYPTFCNNLDISIKNIAGTMTCKIAEGKQSIFEATETFKNGSKAKFEKKRFNTFFNHKENLIKVKLDTLIYSKMYIGKRDFNMNIGDHEISRILNDLNIKNKLFTIYYPNAIEMAGRANKI